MYMPKILLCGDEKKFFSEVTSRPAEIVGKIYFAGKTDDGEKINLLDDDKFILNDEVREIKDLVAILRQGYADYIVFTDLHEFDELLYDLVRKKIFYSQMMGIERFKNLPTDSYFDPEADKFLIEKLTEKNFKTLLDVDALFVRNIFLTDELKNFREVDCIAGKGLPPFKENFYNHIYGKISACRYRHYDAALIVGKSPEEFDRAAESLKNIADVLIVFVRNNSALEEHLKTTADNFFNRVTGRNSVVGYWFFCEYKRPEKNFVMYVVTHKKLPEEHIKNLPDGYELIHAGKKNSKELGYPGDDTGENISDLNPYINEVTAIYHMWKNSSAKIIGLSHYRRFFTESRDENFSYEKILTRESAEKLLEEYDILVTTFFNGVSLFESLAMFAIDDEELAKNYLQIMRKHLVAAHPDYADAFDRTFQTRYFANKNMFVTRRHVFDDFCEWLFSFLIDATKEIIDKFNLADKEPGFAKRAAGFFAEHMLNVWLYKNRLRIKELKIMEVKL